MGAPGCPELACCTASIASVRMVLIDSWSICCTVVCWIADACWLTKAPVRAGGSPQSKSGFRCTGATHRVGRFYVNWGRNADYVCLPRFKHIHSIEMCWAQGSEAG